MVIRRKISKGKKWYTVVAPRVFNEVPIGETLTDNPDSLKGRVIKANYADLAREITKQHISCMLKISDVSDSTAHTELIGYQLSKPYLQRVMRRNSSKIEEVVDMKLKDKNVRIKTYAVTNYKTTNSQRRALRKAIEAEIYKALSNYDLDSLVPVLATNRIQINLSKKIRSIFPVRFFEIRKIDILKERKVKKDLGNKQIVEIKKKESKSEGKKIKIESEEKPEPKEIEAAE